jgi:hypothetical protein
MRKKDEGRTKSTVERKGRGRGGCNHPIARPEVLVVIEATAMDEGFDNNQYFGFEWRTHGRDSDAALRAYHRRVTVLQLMEDAGASALRTDARMKTKPWVAYSSWSTNGSLWLYERKPRVGPGARLDAVQRRHDHSVQRL